MPARWSCIPTARSKAATIHAPTAAPRAYKIQIIYDGRRYAAEPPFRRTPCYVAPMSHYLMRTVLCAFVGLLMASGAASAHPHVWVTMKAQLVYAQDGSVTGVRHAWTFDDMFSVFATQGIDANTKGEFSREELKPLAQTNVESLKDFDYFTYAKSNGKVLEFAEPLGDYYLDYDSKETVLTLHFTLPLKAPVQAKELAIEIFDPSYFVDFSFVEKDANVRRWGE
jgi:ABC-type uncharacterized transport system substrate-binding protein